MTEADLVWQRGPDVAWVGDIGRVVAARVAPPDDSGPRVLEGAAAWIWWALDEPRSAGQLTDRAVEETGADAAQVLSDTLLVLSTLEAARLAKRR